MAENNSTDVAEVPARTRPLVDILVKESCPPALQKFYTDDERAGIAMALEAGDVRREQKNVTVRGKGDQPDEQWPYYQYTAVNAKGMSALSRMKMDVATPLSEVPDYDKLSENQKKRAQVNAKDGAADYFNYGFSLTLMQPIRVMLTNSLGGVDKEIEKQVAQIVKTGLFSETEARAAVLKQRAERGLEIPAIAEAAE